MAHAAASEAIADLKDGLASVSEQIWRQPELKYNEHKAHDLLVSFAEAQGFSVTPHFIHPTAFKAEFERGEGGHVLLISEYDALPDIGHGCGHNLIAVLGVGAAVAVARAMDRYGLAGRVTLLGTPAEEGGGGKLALIEAGALDGVDAALMAHPYRLTASNVPHMALVGLRVRFRGRASHAAQAPWEGRNALDAAVMAYQGVSCLRQQVEPSCRIHGIISKGGAQPNIIPDYTELEFYVRAPKLSLLKDLEQRVRNCFQGAATMTNCEVEVEETVPMYANVTPNPVLARVYRQHAADLSAPGLVDDESELGASGSTDMGNVSQVVPSLHPMFYIGSDEALHTRAFATAAGRPQALDCTMTQAEVLARIALDLLASPDLRREAAQAFGAGGQ